MFGSQGGLRAYDSVLMLYPAVLAGPGGLRCKDTVWADHGVLPDVDIGITHAGQPEVGIDIWCATARKCCGAGSFRFSGDSTNDGKKAAF